MKKIFLIALLLVVACSTNIDTTVKTGNDGFVLGNGSIAVVLTHGLGASPYEIAGLSKYLSARNITVYGVRLAGHGTSYQDLNERTWQEWYKSYSEAYLSVKPLKQKVFVGGMSLGGVIALKLAEDQKVDGVIALAPALILDDTRSNYAWLFKYFSPYSLRNISIEKRPYYYDRFPIASVAESVALSSVVQKDLSKINAPTLIMEYTKDTRVNPVSSQIVYDNIASQNKQIRWINGTGHVMILDDDNKEEYYEEIYQFIIKTATSNS